MNETVLALLTSPNPNARAVLVRAASLKLWHAERFGVITEGDIIVAVFVVAAREFMDDQLLYLWNASPTVKARLVADILRALEYRRKGLLDEQV